MFAPLFNVIRFDLVQLPGAARGEPEQAAVMQIAHSVQETSKAAKTDLTASAKADEAEKELVPGAAAAAVRQLELKAKG